MIIVKYIKLDFTARGVQTITDRYGNTHKYYVEGFVIVSNNFGDELLKYKA